jgi:hypothetical protein
VIWILLVFMSAVMAFLFPQNVEKCCVAKHLSSSQEGVLGLVSLVIQIALKFERFQIFCSMQLSNCALSSEEVMCYCKCNLQRFIA